MAMRKAQGCLFLWALAALSFNAAVEGAAAVLDSSVTVVPAFMWSNSRCLGEQDHKVNYQVQSAKNFVDTVLDNFVIRPATQSDEAAPEMVVAFIGKELRSVDISRFHSSAPSDLLEKLQTSVAGSKYSLSFPYVALSSDKTSVGEALLSAMQKELGSGSKLGEMAVSESCSAGVDGVRKLAGISDVQAYIAARKDSRTQGETDVLMVCYTPSLDRNLPGSLTAEGEALSEVLAALKSTATSNTAVYTSNPQSQEDHYGIMARQLIGSGTSNVTTDCDAVCMSRAVILEGIFVAIVLITILVSGLCCMMGVTSPSRFELPKES